MKFSGIRKFMKISEKIVINLIDMKKYIKTIWVIFSITKVSLLVF